MAKGVSLELQEGVASSIGMMDVVGGKEVSQFLKLLESSILYSRALIYILQR